MVWDRWLLDTHRRQSKCVSFKQKAIYFHLQISISLFDCIRFKSTEWWTHRKKPRNKKRNASLLAFDRVRKLVFFLSHWFCYSNVCAVLRIPLKWKLRFNIKESEIVCTTNEKYSPFQIITIIQRKIPVWSSWSSMLLHSFRIVISCVSRRCISWKWENLIGWIGWYDASSTIQCVSFYDGSAYFSCRLLFWFLLNRASASRLVSSVFTIHADTQCDVMPNKSLGCISFVLFLQMRYS